MLVEQAERCADEDPALAAALLLEVGVADMFSGDSMRWLEVGARAQELAEGAGDEGLMTLFARLACALGLVPLGRAVEAEPVLEAAHAVAARGRPAARRVGAHHVRRPCSSCGSERFDLAEQILNRQIDAARDGERARAPGLPAARPARSCTTAAAAGRRRWPTPPRRCSIARETAQPPRSPWRSRVLALARGRARPARARRARTREEALGHHAGLRRAAAASTPRSTLGFAALAAERLDEALDHLHSADRIERALGGRRAAMLQYESDLIEALMRMGRREDAEQALAQLEQEAELTGRTLGARRRRRARRGMLADDSSYAEHFERALEWHAKSDQPFPAARTRLAYGERLRRAGERVAAREQLAIAAEEFERINATPWAERAQNELRATGQTLRRASMPESDALTPSELQVALRVAEGLTNREVAAAIFLSPKTVEHHLSAIYRKLGIRSRTELARHIAASDPVAAPAPRRRRARRRRRSRARPAAGRPRPSRPCRRTRGRCRCRCRRCRGAPTACRRRSVEELRGGDRAGLAALDRVGDVGVAALDQVGVLLVQRQPPDELARRPRPRRSTCAAQASSLLTRPE